LRRHTTYQQQQQQQAFFNCTQADSYRVVEALKGIKLLIKKSQLSSFLRERTVLPAMTRVS
jgi:hypothetical protein